MISCHTAVIKFAYCLIYAPIPAGGRFHRVLLRAPVQLAGDIAGMVPVLHVYR